MRTPARLLSVFGAALFALVGVLVAPATAEAAESRAICNYD